MSCSVPFARSGNDVRQNAIHLKHCQSAIATAAERDAIDARTTATATRELTSGVLAPQDPRATRAAGLALFASPEGCVALASPPRLAPLVTIGPRFYIVPLVPCTTPEPAVLVLARRYPPATLRRYR